jgi:O-antigen/teichoic acid export membrane protein
MSSFIKDISSVGFSKLAIIAFNLGIGIVTARWLGPEGNGIIAALAVYPSLFMTFGSLGIRQSVTHFIGKGSFSEQTIKTSITQIWMFTTFLSILCSFILIRYFSNSGENLWLVFLAIIPIPFNLFNNYNSGIFLGKNQIGIFNKINWVPSLVIFLFIVLLVVIFPLDIYGAMMATATGPILMFFILLFKNDFIKAFELKFNWEIIRSMLSLGLIYATALLVINLNYRVDIILLDKLSSPFELGIYSKGVSITNFLWEIPMLLSTIVFARSASAKNGLQFSLKVAQLLRISIVAIGIGSVILVLLAKYIILFMYGAKFFKSYQVLQWLMPGVLLLTVFKVLNMDLAGKGKPWVSMKAMVPAVLLNIVLNLLLIPQYGANGSALASTFSYSFASLLFLYFYSKEVHIPIKEILHYSKNDFQPIETVYKKLITQIKK